MNPRIAVSPEITSSQAKKGNLLSRMLKFLAVPIKHQVGRRKWAHHADSRRLDWRWTDVHFNRIAVVNLLLSRFENPKYLEIGCASNTLFNSVHANGKKGVDPSAGGTHRMTSNEFFAQNDEAYDVIFIDGLHTYEQVRLDVIHSLKCLKRPGWIALHDMLPRTWIEQHVPVLTSRAWTGTVWKLAFELMQTPGIEFKILKIDCGVGVIKVLDAEVALCDLTNELSDKEFAYYYDNLHRLPIAEWSDAQEWLRT